LLAKKKKEEDDFQKKVLKDLALNVGKGKKGSGDEGEFANVDLAAM